MSEFISIDLKRSAIVLAEESNFAKAAEKLKIPVAELTEQIATLESQLYCQLFKPTLENVELTEEGQFLIKAFRESVALHDRNSHESPNEDQ